MLDRAPAGVGERAGERGLADDVAGEADFVGEKPLGTLRREPSASERTRSSATWDASALLTLSWTTRAAAPISASE